MAGRVPDLDELLNDEENDFMNMIQDIKVSARDGTRFSLRQGRPEFMNDNPGLFTDQDRRNMADNLVRHSADERRDRVGNNFNERMRAMRGQENFVPIPRRRQEEIVVPFNPRQIFNQPVDMVEPGV
jgi:hypothetical protein